MKRQAIGQPIPRAIPASVCDYLNGGIVHFQLMQYTSFLRPACGQICWAGKDLRHNSDNAVTDSGFNCTCASDQDLGSPKACSGEPTGSIPDS